MAFSNEQHRRRYAEDATYRARKLADNRVYRTEQRERLNALWLEKWRSDASYRERHALTRLRRLYGLSSERYRQMLEQQNGVCAICEGPSRRRLCVDHCGVTREVRGLLCDNCNTAIGLLGHDPERLRAAAAYLQRACAGRRACGGETRSPRSRRKRLEQPRRPAKS